MDWVTNLEPGAIIGGDFKVLRKLGEGGMGVVFEATQLTTGYPRAVKVMRSPFVVDAKACERFEQEARIGARIQSDHVVQVVAAGVEEATRTPWLAMELLQGHDLERHIQTRGPMPLLDVAFVIGQVGHALTAAHDVGVVHRDIKPENVFLSVSRVVGVPFMVKVLDFGIAKLRSTARSVTAAIGTPAYMAPEQTDSREPIGPPADLWPLGLVVFRMLTGEHFWRAASDDSALPYLWREILVDPIPTASERAAELGVEATIPPGFDVWFARCLERDHELRWPHARQALQALEPVLGPAGSDPAISSGKVLASMAAEETHPGAMRRSVSAVQPTLRAEVTGSTSHRVSFHEEGERVVTVAADGATLLDVSLAAGIPHFHACGGKARCSTCRVVVLEGRDNLGARTAAEAAVADRRSWPATTRLACQATVHGPCSVRRLVVDTSDPTMVDIRRTSGERDTRSELSIVLAIRLDGIDTVLGEGFPDDAIHVLERCIAPIEQLVTQTGGRMPVLEGSLVIAAFPAGTEGVRRALRVALRAKARARQLNPYLLRHFGVQVDTAAGVGGGSLVEGSASVQGKPAAVVIGSAVRRAREHVQRAAAGELLMDPSLLGDIEVVARPRADDLVQVIDFAKSDVVYLVQHTFDRLGSQALPFAASFYDALFRLYPVAAGMFANTDLGLQQKMLMDTLGLAVRGLDDFGQVEEALRQLGQRHVDYGVSVRDYKYVGDALLGTLAEFLGDDFTPDVELAWREIYSSLVRTMVGAA